MGHAGTRRGHGRYREDRRDAPAELAALDPPQRREVAKELRKVAENFAGVPDGRNTAHTLRLLAHMLDPC